MLIITDSNVIFSALIRNSATRSLILLSEEKFLCPSFFFEELEKHKDLILKKSKMNQESFEILLNSILEKIEIVPSSILEVFSQEAIELVKNIDIDDAMFFACALAYPGSVIWSDDKKLKNQSSIKILNTREFIATTKDR